MKNHIFSLSLLVICGFVQAQYFPSDSTENISLEEVVIISRSGNQQLKDSKSLGSIDNYLEKSAAVNMIKRGAYAQEPMLQGMPTERSVITLDGMRIYSACTDKMDPVTSYVEITNFSEAVISNGASGSAHGGTVAGSIDLIRKKGKFSDKGFSATAFSGFESVNKQKILGSGLNYSTSDFFANLDFTYRDADNYKAGGGQEVLYSQFTKYNLSAVGGYKINHQQSVEASVIYDRATNIGYPALPMDVSLAEASIASVQYGYKNISDKIDLWETKLYYNQIKHIMDDSQRPDVPIRMDMPGKSKTAGFYSKLKGNSDRHKWAMTLSGHQNNSVAEMTMYPSNPNESQMFMMTWPDVNTLYGGLFAEDKFEINPHLKLDFSASLGLHHNRVKSDFGLNSLMVFYPEMKDSKNRFIKSLHTGISFHHNRWLHTFGMGYSERAPSVSEAYGFYLFNSFDAYDYVGNPFLKNEKSAEFFASTQYKTNQLKVKIQANYFHIYDYIIGKPDENLLPMTIGANGIKVYEALKYARIFNTDLDLEYRFIPGWYFSGKLSYRYGEDFEKNNLPLIQPLSYRFGFRFEKQKWTAQAELEGSTKNHRFSPEFGETSHKDFQIVNLSVSKIFNFNHQKLSAKIGVENLFDQYYSTFSNWNKIPEPGRNIFVNLIYNWK